MEELYEQRINAVDRYLNGESPKSIYTSLNRTKPWLFKWVDRYHTGLSEWYADAPRKPQTNPRKISIEMEALIKLIRLELYNDGVFCGAQAIAGVMEDRHTSSIPSLRTIDRVIRRNDLTHKRTGRYIPKGTTYPVSGSPVPNLRHQADLVGPLYLDLPLRFYSVNIIDIATNRCGLEPLFSHAGKDICFALWSIWRRMGIPEQVSVDNAMYFYGSPKYPRKMGPLIRFCLHHGIEPWFIPVREPWRNGCIEKFNDHYQQKFLGRVPILSAKELSSQTLSYENKHNERYRYSKLKGKTPLQALAETKQRLRFPKKDSFRWPLPQPQRGQYHLVRLIRSDRKLDIFGEKFPVDPDLQYQYVVATINVKEQKLSVKIDNNVVEEFEYEF
jgi:putative transposase